MQRYESNALLGPRGSFVLILEGRVYHIKDVRVIKWGGRKKKIRPWTAL